MALDSLPAREHSPGSLIHDGEWDSYDLESLLPLQDAYRETTALGFLLRHYWVPATILSFRRSCRDTSPEGVVTQQESLIERTMVRCHSNECVWRERSVPFDSVDSAGPDAWSDHRRDILCSYNCHEQAFRTSSPVSRDPPAPADTAEAKRQALCRLSMLAPPPGPVLVGLEWRGEVEDDYMDYRLEAEERVRETSVVLIRRKGRFHSLFSEREEAGDGVPGAPAVTERQGVALFAWKRGVVLEDRYLDRLVETDGRSRSSGGKSTLVVTRLVRSRPAED